MKEEEGIDIVLTDINMPGMDGLTLIAKLSESNPLTKSIIISAYGDMENIRAAMNRGAYDFLCKPVNFQDLDVTIQKTISYVTQLHQTIEAIRENNILKMYVDKNVLNFMSSREFESSLMLSENINGTVVFVDICNFTAITEKENFTWTGQLKPASRFVKKSKIFPINPKKSLLIQKFPWGSIVVIWFPEILVQLI